MILRELLNAIVLVTVIGATVSPAAQASNQDETNQGRIQRCANEKLVALERSFDQLEDQACKESLVLDKFCCQTIGLNCYFPHDINGCKFPTHGLALAIFAGDLKRVEKFFSALKDPNDPRTFTRYPQLYNLVHQAAHPDYLRVEGVPFKTRLDIIRYLAFGGVDVNWIPDPNSNLFANPPLEAGKSRGNSYKDIPNIRMMLLLCGADPEKRGSSYLGLVYPSEMAEDGWLWHWGYGPDFWDEALKMLEERAGAAYEFDPARLHPATKKALDQARKRRDALLDNENMETECTSKTDGELSSVTSEAESGDAEEETAPAPPDSKCES